MTSPHLLARARPLGEGGGGGGGEEGVGGKEEKTNLVPRAFPFFVTKKGKAMGTRLREDGFMTTAG